MKRLLLFLLSLWAFTSYSQALSEGFEGTSIPNYTTDDWVLGSGTWKVFDNGVGAVANSWRATPTAALAYAGTRAAYLNFENITPNATAIDWLVSPSVTVPVNGQIRFFTRTAQPNNQGSSMSIRISTTSQTDASTFTTLQTWTETQLVGTYAYDEYHQIFVDLPVGTYPVGSTIYVAFVMENDNGDRWMVDNVYVDSKCLVIPDTSLNATNILSDSAMLQWGNPSGATEWEIEWGPAGFTQGTGTLISPVTQNPYPLSGLSSLTEYDFYVRANCGNENISPWSESYSFTTAKDYCGGDAFTDTGEDGNYGNNQDVTWTICPENAGDVVQVFFNSFNTETNWDGLYVYNGPSTASPLIASGNGAGNVPGGVAGSYWGTNIPGPFISTHATGCLTFRFRSDGSGVRSGWNATVVCSQPPSCPQPTALQVISSTTTTATIGWTENTPAVTSWQIVVQAVGSGYPSAGDTTITTSLNPRTVENLTPGTQYEFYVTSNCPAGDNSFWSGPRIFYTLPVNDECATAIVAPVNEGSSCLQTVHGTIQGATASTQGNTCAGTDDDDVWFQFTATETVHNVSLINVTGSTTDLDFVIYSGSCGSLTQVVCSPNNSISANNLVPGQVYYIRVYSWTGTANQNTQFDVCITVPPSCENSEAFCGNSGLVYPNTTGAASYGSIGCLFTTPNPAWFFMQVSQPGTINFQIAQSGTTGNGLDVDYIVWGPFTSSQFDTMCNSLYDFPDGNASVPNNQVSCSYSAAAIENFTINNAQVGQIYVVLITNYSNQTGTVTFTQTGGTGATNCEIVCDVDLGEDQVLCADSYTITASNTTADAYEWYNGNDLIPGATTSTYTATESGIYTCVIHCGINSVEDSVNVTLNSVVVPTFTTIGPLCAGSPNVTLPEVSSNGVFGSWQLATATVTEVDASTAGVFNYVFIPEATNPCASQVTMQVQILGTCTFGGFASAAWVDNCETADNGEFFNTTGSGANLIGSATNVFPATDYGVYLQGSGNLIFGGGEVKTFKTTDTNVCGVKMYYRVYEASTTPLPPFSDFIQLNVLMEDCGSGSFPSGGPCNTGDQKWQNIAAGVDLTNNTPGNYIIQVYYEISGSNTTTTECTDTVFLDNAGSYFSANFTIQATPTFTFTNETCDSSNGAITVSGMANALYDVTYADGGVTVGPTPFQADLEGNITIGGLNAGVYDNFVFEINGCQITSSPAITITNFSPSVTGVTNNSPICFGENVVFTVTGTPNYSIDYTVNGIAGTTAFDTTGTAVITVVNPAVGNVDLAVLNIHDTFCNIPTTNTSTTVVNPLPTATVASSNAYTCIGTDGQFVFTGTPNATVNYTVNGGLEVPVILDETGTATVNIPSTDDIVVVITTVVDGTTACTATIVGQSASTDVVDVAEPTYTTTEPSCGSSDGVITVTAPLSQFVNTATDLFISEVTDALTSNVNYIELYNGTGSAIDLSNYKLRIFLNGNTTAACDLPLSGTLANNGVYVVKSGTGADIAGVAYNAAFTGCTASINNNDVVALTNLSNTVIDIWGTYPTFTPAGSTGYDYRRNSTGVTLPSATWNAADWNAIDWVVTADEDYTNVGVYSFYSSYYEYILNDGTTSTTQDAVAFTGLAAGNYTLVAHDLIANCSSEPVTIALNAQNATDPVTTFTYTTPVCQDNANLLPDTSIANFTTGGTFTSATGLDINGATGEINVSNSTPGMYTVTYAVLVDAVNCVNAGSSTFDITINAATVSTFNAMSLCQNATGSLPATSLEGFTGTWTPSSIDTSAVGTSIYSFTPDAGQCASAGTLTVTITAGPVATFNAMSLCQNATGTFPATSLEGFTGTWSPSSIDTSAVGTSTYNFTPDAGQCASPGTLTVTITAGPVATFNAMSLCQNATGTFPATSLEGFTGTWTPSSIDTSAVGTSTYAFTPASGQCASAGTLTVTITAGPTATFNAISLCQNDSNNGLPTASSEGFTGTWTLGGSAVTSIDTSEDGSYTYVFTPNSGQCASGGTLSVMITASSSISFASVEVCGNATVEFPTRTEEGYTLAGTWSPSSVDTSEAGETTYTFTPSDVCYTSGTFTVNVIGCMIPKGISPNGDGSNDTFDLSSFDVKTLEIFNRYGRKVYTRNNYVNEWDGKADNGYELPDGTYYYVITFDNLPAKTGWVYINRQH